MRLRLLLSAVAAAALVLGPAPATVATAQPALFDCDVADDGRDLDEIEWALLDRINAFRAELGLEVVERSPALERVARWKAASLAAGGPRPLQVEDHDDPGRTWDQRFIDCGYPASAGFGENLGVTNGTVDDLFAGWVQSPSHLANLAHPDWRYIGLARADAGDGFTFWANAYGTEP